MFPFLSRLTTTKRRKEWKEEDGEQIFVTKQKCGMTGERRRKDGRKVDDKKEREREEEIHLAPKMG